MGEIIRKRIKRYNYTGQVHFLTFSCCGNLKLFDNSIIKEFFLESPISAKQKHSYYLIAFVIMPEHIHLLVRPQSDKYNISSFLQSVKQPVALKAKKWISENDAGLMNKLQRFSKGKYRFRFWLPGGGYDRNILKHETLLKAIDYIHKNPVRRDLVKNPADYYWSSAGWYEGKDSVCIQIDGIA